MSHSSPLPDRPHVNAIERLEQLQQTDPRAQFRALLPVLDRLVRLGVSHQAVVDTLAASGVSVTLSAFRKALYRWRNKTSRPTEAPASAGMAPLESNLSGPPSPAPTQAGSPHTHTHDLPGEILGKADLVRLRASQQHIDLTHLADLGRRKR